MIEFFNITPSLAFMGLGPLEMMIFGVAAVLLFGRNLPSVARSAGKSLTEFKKGMQDIQEEVRVSIDTDSSVVASNRSTKVLSNTEEDETTSEDDDYARLEGEANHHDTVNDDDDESLQEGYPIPRSASSGISDDSKI